MAPANTNNDSNFGFASRSETWLGIAMLTTLVVLLVPLPTILLDMLLAVNLAAAILLLLVVLGAKRPLDVSVFPSILLLLTLFRLSLNVSTTRLILLNTDAGKIVLAFGDFVVGGNLIVGVVIFLILVTIQFIVITKGATRISEVNARFTLDAMPGKQMAIDAELNAGSISEQQAREKRASLTKEAEFYGAMDGASKYVRGDAIAGLIIMVVNIVGGMMLGVAQGQNLTDALQVYSILTIGDGLVSQIPALVIATSAGILVTKSSSESSLGDEIGFQFTRNYRSMYTGAFLLLLISFTPGFPKLPFLAIGVALLIFVNTTKKRTLENESHDKEAGLTESNMPETEGPNPEEKNLNEFLQVDRVVIEIGAGLIPLVESKKGKGIAERIGTLRESMAKQYGFWIPQARIKDNLLIGVHEYRFIISGREVGRGELMVDHNLAINPGQVSVELDGIKTRDPAFDLPAIWIEEVNRRRAEAAGFTVVDTPTVMITHLGECLRIHAHELLSREDMQKMLDKLREYAPSTVDDIRPDSIKPGQLHQVLVALLAEGVPITYLEKIVESAIYYAPLTKSVIELVEKIRATIGHLICDPFRGEDGRVRVLIFEPKLEHQLRQSIQNQTVVLSPSSLENLVSKIQEFWESAKLKNEPVALLVDSSLRFPIKQTLQRSLRDISVIAYNEIPNDTVIDALSVVSFDDVVAQDEGSLMADFESAQGEILHNERNEN